MNNFFKQRSVAVTLPTIILVATYVCLAVIKINHPGVHFDEAIHVNAAIGGIDQTFIFRKIGNFPLLLMPYVGALKSYLTAPIFWLFGVTPLTIRLPMILAAALGLAIFFATARKFFGAKIALVALFLLALDPSFIALTRVDFGPVVLAFIARTAALLLFWHFIKTKKAGYLIGLLITLGLGIFNKLDFIWFFNALVASSVVAYFKEIKNIVTNKKTIRRLVITLVAVGGTAALAGYYLIVSHHFNLFSVRGISDLNFLNRTQNVLGNLFYQLNGELFYYNAFGFLHTMIGRATSWTLIGLSVLAVLLAAFDPKKLLRYKKEFWFFVLILFFSLAQIFVTSKAVWPWHTFSTYPAITLIIAYGFYAVFVYLKILFKNKTKALAVLAIMFAALLSYNLWMNTQYIKVYTRPLYKVFWANEIYDLVDWTKAQPEKFISIDWGIHNQLIVLASQKNKYLNASFRLNNKKLKDDQKDELLADYWSDPEHSLYILHVRRESLFKVARDNFFSLSKEAGFKPKKIKEFNDGQKIIFEIYRLSRPPLSPKDRE